MTTTPLVSVPSANSLTATTAATAAAATAVTTAVCVRDVWLGYDNKHRSKADSDANVLRGVFMNIAPATIYGLLGPSGCGKTTLLQCIVGFLKPCRGDISIYGLKQGDPKLRIPGIDVGYMPQESEIYDELTIEETLLYFGRIGQTDLRTIVHSIKSLVQILELPEPKRLVRNLSGGQKRRVSFALSIIHNPKLLILDEPTAGADPVVARKIWLHLKHICKKHNTAIIVTTHYIEEAIGADRVGLMRKGHILREDAPKQLLAAYETDSLEKVFQKICNIEKNRTTISRHDQLSSLPSSCETSSPSNIINAITTTATTITPTTTKLYKPSYRKDALGLNGLRSFGFNAWLAIILAINWKNWTRNYRNPIFMLFQFILPIGPMVLYCLCFGKEPFDIPLGIVNYEAPANYSKNFIDKLNSYHFTPINFSSIEEALIAAKANKIWGIVRIKANFTRAIHRRTSFHSYIDSEDIIDSTIELNLDHTTQINNIFLRRSLDRSYLAFIREISAAIVPPIQRHRPIFGQRKIGRYDNYLEFSTPAMLVMICFCLTSSLSALLIALERQTQMLDRHYISGVSIIQFLIAHIINRLNIAIFHVSTIMIITINIFKVFAPPSLLSIASAFCLLLSQTICGVSAGMLLTSLTSNLMAIVVIAVSLNFGIIFISGVVWPVEAMAIPLRWISYMTPCTIPAEGLRSILSRGCDINDPIVIQAFGVTLLWFIINFSLGLQRFKST